MKLKICKYEIDFSNYNMNNMNNICKLHIKCFCDENTCINKPENIPIRFLPNDYNKDNYTIIEKDYLVDTNDAFTDYYIESKYEECYLCKCNIDYFDIKNKLQVVKNSVKLNDIVFSKLEKIFNNKNNNNLFVYQSKINSESYIYYYYHLCKTCYKHSLYYWSLCNTNKYPSTRIDGYRFINNNDKFVPEIKKKETVKLINNLDIPNIYICDFYNCENKNYNYLD